MGIRKYSISEVEVDDIVCLKDFRFGRVIDIIPNTECVIAKLDDDNVSEGCRIYNIYDVSIYGRDD